MKHKFSGSSSETLNKIWTKAAIECFFIGCRCSKCYLHKVFFSKRKYKCKMKEAVIELVKNIGVPENLKYDI